MLDIQGTPLLPLALHLPQANRFPALPPLGSAYFEWAPPERFEQDLDKTDETR